MQKIPQTQKGSNPGYVIGRNAFSKISAIEGIQLTKEMRNDFQVFEQKGFSPKDRREAIFKKYSH